ncbi:winged helix-turn-helix domain-containing protein [Sutterella sp.]|uniref:winged helix-turn-helix domain-containing protein n=1 Tax=Sutterella sp. TaxID=1981025 RepID=UPI0026DF952B|nr:winged helix-turn-helix domain-containing protein [Sutterella sp.]MDO5531552.1 winged helix-turn-helix domain-containing protein [Sutterella sp.]
MRLEKWLIGEFTVSSATNTIERQGHPGVKLPPRLIDTLLFLARHQGEVLTRKELVDGLWERTVVTDQTVTQLIFELRKYLRDGRARGDAPEYVVTVPKRGYQLVAQASLLDCGEEVPAEGTVPESPAGKPATPPPAETRAEVPENAPVKESAQPEKPAEVSPSEATEPEKKPRKKKNSLKELVKSLWLDESTAGFKRTIY